jgi:hypothetical protein
MSYADLAVCVVDVDDDAHVDLVGVDHHGDHDHYFHSSP